VNDHPRPGDMLELDRDECVRRLTDAPWARIAFTTDSGPRIFPINHLVMDDAVFFRTSPGSKLASAVRGAPVALEVDGGDAASRLGWSVVARGESSIVHDEELIEKLMLLPFEPWTLPEDKAFWVKVEIDDITGRTIVPKRA
jgi:nitroimidazol reductase NimA-like FMN-containing flavoprotein (pyridoxamine 5'-phosphate oxidase superfamily)